MWSMTQEDELEKGFFSYNNHVVTNLGGPHNRLKAVYLNTLSAMSGKFGNPFAVTLTDMSGKLLTNDNTIKNYNNDFIKKGFLTIKKLNGSDLYTLHLDIVDAFFDYNDGKNVVFPHQLAYTTPADTPPPRQPHPGSVSKMAQIQSKYNLKHDSQTLTIMIYKFEDHGLTNDAKKLCTLTKEVVAMDKFLRKYNTENFNLDDTLKKIKKTNGKAYKVSINTPSELWDKYPKWVAGLDREVEAKKSTLMTRY